MCVPKWIKSLLDRGEKQCLLIQKLKQTIIYDKSLVIIHFKGFLLDKYFYESPISLRLCYFDLKICDRNGPFQLSIRNISFSIIDRSAGELKMAEIEVALTRFVAYYYLLFSMV